MKNIIVIIVMALAFIDTARAADLYWRIVDGRGKLLAEVSGDLAGVPSLEKRLQSRYSGIKLSIKNCRRPTLVETMNPVYGKHWQCGSIIYRGHVMRSPKQLGSVVMFEPSNSQWHYLGYDTGNDIMFINKPHLSNGNIFIWTEDYGAFALADAVSKRTGINVYAIDFENGAPDSARRNAEEIVNSYPSEIGGSIYRTSIHVQRYLYEINCTLRQMKNIQTTDEHGKVMDASVEPWFKLTLPDGRLKLMQRECGQ